ncbi:uncharacterized protein UBRO_20412 [Ustilago bromivora]|uniref:Uncharacterized protein n=1 Tax=Ustilago bromivora TaxID=307758 RepID=A0A1K0GZ58_9BASI|nr:uncharacterized protein UBRO_20412 [Ustilago bromivora]
MPLPPDDMAISAGSFCLNEVIANPAEAIEWGCPVCDVASTCEIADKPAEDVDDPPSHIFDHVVISETAQAHTAPNSRPNPNPASEPPIIIFCSGILTVLQHPQKIPSFR